MKSRLIVFFSVFLTNLLSGGVSFQPEPATAIEGGALKLPLTISHTGDLVGFQMDLAFDPTLLTPDGSLSGGTYVVDSEVIGPGLLRLIVLQEAIPLTEWDITTSLIIGFQVTAALADDVVVTSLSVAAALAVDHGGGRLSNDVLGTVAATLRRSNHAPSAFSQQVSGTEDVVLGGILSGNDADQDPLTFLLETQPVQGLAFIPNPQSGSFTYVPSPNAEGLDVFTFRVSDGREVSPPATVTVILTAVNDPPTSTSLTATFPEDTVTTLIPDIDDPDQNETHTLTLLTQPEHGGVAVSQKGFTYTPVEHFHGSDQFSYRVTDQGGQAVEGEALLTIEPVNDEPVLENVAVSGFEDLMTLVELAPTDPDDGDVLTLSIVSVPQFGIARLTGPGTVTYTPDENAVGLDRIGVRVTDAGLLSTEAEISLEIQPVNDPPTAASAVFELCTDVSGEVVPNVDDVDLANEGDTYTFTILSQPGNGSAMVATDSLRYEPDPGFSGSDAFEFRATDSGGSFIDADAVIQVLPLTEIDTITGLPQGLEPLILEAETNCGVDFLTFVWVETGSGVQVGVGPVITLDPPPEETTTYDLTITHLVNGTQLNERITILVHPLGGDLNGDQVNTLDDLYLVLPSWYSGDPTYDADGDGSLSILDLLYIPVGVMP